MFFILFHLIAYIIFINTQIQNMQDILNNEEWRTKLEWSECYILEKDHPWKGLKVRKRHHPLLFFNQTQELLKENEYQYNLCDCFQPINSFITEKRVEDNHLMFRFKYMMTLEKISFQTDDWFAQNLLSIQPELELSGNDHFNPIILKTRTVNIMNESLMFRMENPMYFMNARVRLEGANFENLATINIMFYGCSLACGGLKTSTTDIIYYIQLQINIPTVCLWYLEPLRSTSLMFNILDKELDCETSDVMMADGSKNLNATKNNWITSVCTQGVDSVENLLFQSVWVLYKSGSSRKTFIEHFSLLYHGGCDRQYVLVKEEGAISVSIHGASDIQKMKFDCSIYLRRLDKQGFVISFTDFYLFSLTKSSCTSNYIMIYSGNAEIHNIPFCDSISPPKYIDARYGWMRLKIINSAPIYDINITIKYHSLKNFNLSLLNYSNTKSSDETMYEKTAGIIMFWSTVGIVIFAFIGVIFFDRIGQMLDLIKQFIKAIKRRKKYNKENLTMSNLDSFL